MSKKKVLVAMSGGVDSSLTAALLKENGYDVTGVTMQIWPAEPGEQIERQGGCCSLSAVDDARRVADTLGIPYYVMNFRDYFEKKVIDYFTAEYLQGRTPNPCIACNRHVKFEAFLTKALALGFDYMATGHYARLGWDEGYGRYVMRLAADDKKDQTYALYTMTQEQIKHTLMPLGEFTKEQTRAMARDLGLTVAEKPDSQEICFVLDNDYKRFVKERAGNEIKPGPFLDTRGNVLGTHEGLAFYTVGQRKGLGMAFGEPVYVVALDPERNAVILGNKDEVWGSELVAGDINLILYAGLEAPIEVEAKIRYNSSPSPAVLEPVEDGLVRLQFKEPQRAITPGQAVVFYLGDYVVGGGTILKSR